MQYIIKTDVGVVRSENQDRAAFFVKNGVSFAILCDGMGGHMGGSHASSIAIAIFEKEFAKANLNIDTISKWFTDTLHLAVKAMRKKAEEDAKLLDMGTTLTAACIMDREIIVFNIGDSRTYAYTGILQQITRDHNLRNYYIDHYHYTEDEASQLIGAAALTSALGPSKTSKPEAFVIDRSGVEYMVLTSDGVHDYIPKPVLEQVIGNATSLDEKGEEIITRAIRGKSSDNLTVLILRLT